MSGGLPVDIDLESPESSAVVMDSGSSRGQSLGGRGSARGALRRLILPETVVLRVESTLVADAAGLKRAATRVVGHRESDKRIVTVLPARSKTANELISLAHEVSPNPNRREMDMLLSTGGLISCALCAMMINDLGHRVVSLTGPQAGIVTDTSHTEARIIDVRTSRISEALDEDRIVVVAGCQGVSRNGEITTLGRGGSDATAVALAAAIGAKVCEI